MMRIVRTILFAIVLLAGFCACQKRYVSQIPLALDFNDTYPMKLKAEEGSCLIVVTSTGTWNANLTELNEPWCTLENASGAGRGYVKLNYGENTSPEIRSARFVVRSGDREVSFPIIQAEAK